MTGNQLIAFPIFLQIQPELVLAEDAVWALTPDGRHLYGSSGFYERNPQSGLLSEFDTFGLVSAYARTSPDGAFIYDGDGVFPRDPETGALTAIQSIALGTGFVVGEDFIATPGTTVTFHERDPVTGIVGTSYGVSVAPTATTTLVAAAGADAVYGIDPLPGFDESTLVVFDRDPGTGLFSLAQDLRPDGGSPYLRGAAVSPDPKPGDRSCQNAAHSTYALTAATESGAPGRTRTSDLRFRKLLRGAREGFG